MKVSRSLFRFVCAGLFAGVMMFGMLSSPALAATLTGIVYESDLGAALEGDDGQFYVVGPEILPVG
ncbi:hypothetical protein [Desulfovibrio inopinatus]|uniref:hypothetical protein n=1 Tax=Desulfovibrio inopinatus TaxID=102109 RepID=UPI000485821A|nr:hypothetical protein [Desulfovibrio inopinatus]